MRPSFSWSVFFVTLFGGMQQINHGIHAWLQYQGRSLLRLQDFALEFERSSHEKISAMELEGELGIFQCMSGEDENHPLVRFNKALLHQLLQTCKRDGRCRLTADALGPDFSLGQRNFYFSHLLDRAFRLSNHAQRFFPRCRIANADRRGHGLSLYWNQLLAAILANGPHQWIRTFRLNH